MRNGERINDVQAFCRVVEEEKGLLVIVDVARRPQAGVHHPACRFITEASFVEKVIRNHSKNGHYLWYDEPQSVAADLGDYRRCSHCFD